MFNTSDVAYISNY